MGSIVPCQAAGYHRACDRRRLRSLHRHPAVISFTFQGVKGNDHVVRAVFLDRDGVINANLERHGKPVAPTCLAEFQILPGVEEALHRLKRAGFLLVIVTNQPDVPNGITPRATVEAMHALIRRRMPIDDIKICFHVDADGCPCRKPNPGMILEAAAEHGIELTSSYMVGDRWRDMHAGRSVGCFTIFVDYGYPQDRPHRPHRSCARCPRRSRISSIASAPVCRPARPSGFAGLSGERAAESCA